MGSETGELPMTIERSDIGIILIDEFEKADNPVFNFFLDLLEEGKFTDSQSNVYDLDGYLIIFTSNLSPENYKKDFLQSFALVLIMFVSSNYLQIKKRKIICISGLRLL